MNRRDFIRMFALGSLLAPAMPVVALSASKRRILVQQSSLAGFQYYEGERLFDLLYEGTPLRLVRDPENRYDKNAVAVYIGDAKLGFVPRADNCAVSQMLDRGESLSARIVSLQQSKNPWDRIRFEVVLDG